MYNFTWYSYHTLSYQSSLFFPALKESDYQELTVSKLQISGELDRNLTGMHV